MISLFTLLVFALGVFSIPQQNAPQAGNQTQGILAALQQKGYHSFVQFVRDAKLDQYLQQCQNCTVFAPNEEAMRKFSQLNQTLLGGIANKTTGGANQTASASQARNVTRMVTVINQAIVGYHISQEKVDLPAGNQTNQTATASQQQSQQLQMIPTILGLNITATKSDGSVLLDNTTHITEKIQATNQTQNQTATASQAQNQTGSVAYGIDNVLSPTFPLFGVSNQDLPQAQIPPVINITKLFDTWLDAAKPPLKNILAGRLQQQQPATSSSFVATIKALFGH